MERLNQCYTYTDIVLHNEGRVERFIDSQSLEKKIFDYGESKKHVPLVAECFSSPNNDNNQIGRRIDDEILSIIAQLENEIRCTTQSTELRTLPDNFYELIGSTLDEIAQGCFYIYARDTFFIVIYNNFYMNKMIHESSNKDHLFVFFISHSIMHRDKKFMELKFIVEEV